MLPYMDLHCDTLMGCVEPNFSLRDNEVADKMVDLERLHRAQALAQCFAVFMPQRDWFIEVGKAGMTDEEYIQLATGAFWDWLGRSKDIVSFARTADEIEANHKAGLVSALLTMEDGRPIDGKLENVDRFFEMGFRMIALLWNYENCIGYPNSKNETVMSKGLKPFGKEVVRRMSELGMLVDVSHLNEGGFWDVAELIKGPFVASHSNARALSPHQRNLTDEQLRVLGEHGGITGLNFCVAFVDPECRGDVLSTASMIARHARHIADVGGVDCCAIGTDFDGIGRPLEVGSPEEMVRLFEAFKKVGFSEDEIEKVAYKNAMRVWKEVVR